MNGHADNHQANCQSHHELLEEIAQLKHRERVLIGEKDQLRAQLVEMKEQEKKKYDDLMVQYNMKREHRENGGLDRDGMTVKEDIKEEIKEEEDDGLDKQGTSNNQVTVKTEWDGEEVKVEIKEENHNIFIKREYVSAYIKTESSDVKVEIKEEDEDGCDRCFMKKEEVEDGEETRIIDMETLTEDYQIKREIKEEDNEMTLHNDQIGDWVMREIKEEEEEKEGEGNETTIKEEMVELKEEIKEEEDEEEEDGSAQIDSIEGWAESNQSGDDECQALDNVPLNTTLTHPTGQSQLTVTQSADLLAPQTSTAQDETSPTALDQQTTVPTRHNKRKQQTSKRSVKRSKITIEEDEGEDGEDIANEDTEELKVKVLHLNCTKSNCNVKLDSIYHLHDHLSTVHHLSPLQCFATNCNARFDNRQQISAHNKQNHSRSTRFLCSVCFKKYGSQHKTYQHWNYCHLTGQFECNFESNCAQVTDTRGNMRTHQLTKHQSNHFHCTHPGCTASFSCNSRLKQHQLTHLATNQFHCNWPHCSKQCKLRSNLIQHIRTQHFGLPKSMKAQNEKNIVDLRDPNEYVRVVVDE